MLGEFQTLVNPGARSPPFIAVLTGITDSMVAGAPRIETVLPAFLEFAARPVLVAHNAPFDIGFLRRRLPASGRRLAGASRSSTRPSGAAGADPRRGPQLQARHPRRLFGAGTTPNHRALADARATVDVLHGLIERLGAARACSRWKSCDLLLAGQHGAAPQASPRRGAAPAAGRLPLPRRAGPGPLRREVPRPPHPRPLLLHRVRDALPMGEMVGLAERVDPDRVRHGARGRGP